MGVVVSREDQSYSTERASDAENVFILRSDWIIFVDMCTFSGM